MNGFLKLNKGVTKEILLSNPGESIEPLSNIQK